MDKQTFYAELSERLLGLGLSREYIERHISQFEMYFKGKSDSEISNEISKLGDLNKVAARIKRMTEKSINEAKIENDSKTDNSEKTDNEMPETESADNNVIINREEDELVEASDDDRFSDDDVTVFEKSEDTPIDAENDSDVQSYSESHGTKRGVAVVDRKEHSVTVSALDQEAIEKNRKKFWIIFAATSPITAALLAATAATFALAFFAIAVIILIAVGALVFITAAGTVVSIFGLIFGVSQMINSVPIGLYECGVSVMIAAVAIFVGILVYNFAVRLMPYAAKWLLVFLRYVARKYRELYVYLKKECIGL